jgi:Tfp pilus assembly protein PilF
LASIETAIDIDPRSVIRWKEYFELASKMNYNKEQLRNMYTRALEENTKSIELITMYAKFLESIGTLQGAREQWQLAITVNPSNSAVYKVEVDRLTKLMQG